MSESRGSNTDYDDDDYGSEGDIYDDICVEVKKPKAKVQLKTQPKQKSARPKDKPSSSSNSTPANKPTGSTVASPLPRDSPPVDPSQSNETEQPTTQQPRTQQPTTEQPTQSSQSSASTYPQQSVQPFEPPSSDPVVDYDDESDELLTPLNLVVIGHVDAGKSTLMGHLLVKMNAVAPRQLEKFRRESKQIGKGSFYYAWVLDEGEDERRRGVTIDVTVKYFNTKTKKVTILDAPGHKDFVPNMLLGAVQADAAMLVVDAKNVSAGFAERGQTREHVQLVRSLGISRLIVVVNKMDLVEWNESEFLSIKDRLHAFVTGPDVRYKSDSVLYIPASAFEGVNLVNNSDGCPAFHSWWTGPSLVGAIDSLGVNETNVPPPLKPSATDELKVCVSEVWSSGNSLSVSAKIESGRLSVGDSVVILPENVNTTVRSLRCRGRNVRQCSRGDCVESIVLRTEPINVHTGSVITFPPERKTTTPSTLIVTRTLTVRLLVLDVDIPICQGQQVMSYVHNSVQPVVIQSLVGLIDKSTRRLSPKKPRAIGRADVAFVELSLPDDIVVDNYGPHSTSLCRVILRDRGKTIAAGLVVDPSTI